VTWTLGEAASDLFAADASPLPAPGNMALRVPKAFLDLANQTVWHSDPERFALLYALLTRLQAQPGLLGDRADRQVQRLNVLAKAVRRDMHKMKAFVRFRELGTPEDTRRRFAAWFEPAHHIVEPTAPFFARRFADMDWSILTPQGSAHFSDGELSFAEGMERPPLPGDATEELWTTYFRNIFNPARLKVKAMQAEMPRKYWHNMPEAAAIPELIAGAEARVRQMQQAAPTLPPRRAVRLKERMMQQESSALASSDGAIRDLAALRDQVNGCRRCPLYANATQAVPGEGPIDAQMMIVGEQPGDQEDLAGRPFVGPAGQLFDRAAEAAGMDRSQVFVTNAVKHFKFTPRGKRRIHQRPNGGEISQCKWWLDAERQLIRPKLLVALGATAAEALTGSGKSILSRRGRVDHCEDGTPVFLTVHPSYLLRLPDPELKQAETARFEHDLRAAQAYLGELSPPS
jgi:DNA polymerase